MQLTLAVDSINIIPTDRSVETDTSAAVADFIPCIVLPHLIPLRRSVSTEQLALKVLYNTMTYP